MINDILIANLATHGLLEKFLGVHMYGIINHAGIIIFYLE